MAPDVDRGPQPRSAANSRSKDDVTTPSHNSRELGSANTRRGGTSSLSLPAACGLQTATSCSQAHPGLPPDSKISWHF